MNVGSLFSGVGGFDLGLEWAGMRVLWQVEYDKQCQQVLRHRFPETELHGDVREVGGVQLAIGERPAESTDRGDGCTARRTDPRRLCRPSDEHGRAALAPVDLICGGFPCQDLSVAGKRAGLDGDRSGLWFEFHRIIAELSPRWVLIENVPGLLSSNNGRDMGVVLRGLAELGYGWAYRVLDSQYFGVAQRRRRVFIIGHLGAAEPAIRALFPVGTGLPGDTAPSRETRPRVAALTGNGVGTCGADGNQQSNGDICRTLDRPTGREYDIVTAWPEVSMPMISAGGQANAEVGVGICPTLNLNGEQPIKFDQSVPRRLTPRECERLQGFPDDWTLVDGMKDGPRYRMMGNAVTVNVAEWIGHRILEVDGEAV